MKKYSNIAIVFYNYFSKFTIIITFLFTKILKIFFLFIQIKELKRKLALKKDPIEPDTSLCLG